MMCDMMTGRSRELPQPNEHFRWVQDASGPALVCTPLQTAAAHLFTTRAWTLGGPASGAEVTTAWAEVARVLEVPPARLARVRQVHGASVAVVRGMEPSPADADIIVARGEGVAVAVQAADCVPLLLADRRTGAVAAAHAGWRGLAAGVPPAAVAALAREFGSRADDLIAALGPSIGACCYQVGEDVRRRFEEELGARDSLSRWFLAQPAAWPANPPMARIDAAPVSGRWFLDMWAAAREQLAAAGVRPDQTFCAGLCTASHPSILCSYRRDGAPAGRMAAAIRSAPPRPSLR
jgi:YfiH family protein